MPASGCDHYDRGYHSKHQEPLFTDERYFIARAELSLDYFTARERAGRVFDYGCGLGATIALLPDAEGWDVSAEAREACRRRGIRVYENLGDVPAGSYDVVICRHVLEHVEDPLGTLRTIRRLLKPEGTLILVLPKERHWLPRTDEPDINQHLYCWTPRTIYNLLLRAGYEAARASFRYPFGALRLMPVRRLFGRKVYRALVRSGEVFRRNGEMIVRARVTTRRRPGGGQQVPRPLEARHRRGRSLAGCHLAVRAALVCPTR